MVVSSVPALTSPQPVELGSFLPYDVRNGEDGSTTDLSSGGTLGWLSSCGRRSAKAMFMEIKDITHYWYLAEGAALRPLMVVRLGSE
jgi:hypothetical protein